MRRPPKDNTDRIAIGFIAVFLINVVGWILYERFGWSFLR